MVIKCKETIGGDTITMLPGGLERPLGKKDRKIDGGIHQ